MPMQMPHCARNFSPITRWHNRNEILSVCLSFEHTHTHPNVAVRTSVCKHYSRCHPYTKLVCANTDTLVHLALRRSAIVTALVAATATHPDTTSPNANAHCTGALLANRLSSSSSRDCNCYRARAQSLLAYFMLSRKGATAGTKAHARTHERTN